VTGLFGVMNGAASDLRTGLPKQMTEIHEPVRLHLIVEATPEMLTQICRAPARGRGAGEERVGPAGGGAPGYPRIYTFDARTRLPALHAAKSDLAERQPLARLVHRHSADFLPPRTSSAVPCLISIRSVSLSR
jgi:hypothetical protein